MAIVKKPPTEQEIVAIEKELNRLYARNDHEAIKRIRRRLLDEGLVADFEMRDAAWYVRREQSFDELKAIIVEGLNKEREVHKATEAAVPRSAADVTRAQYRLAERERHIHEKLKRELAETDDHGKKDWLVRRAHEELDRLHRELQQQEVQWPSKPNDAARQEARERMENYKHGWRDPRRGMEMDWAMPDPWQVPSRDEQERAAAKKKEEERLSPPDIDRSLAAMLDGIDINMRGESSEQQETTDQEAAEPGGEGAADNAGRRSPRYETREDVGADFNWEGTDDWRAGDGPEPGITTDCDCDEWNCEHYRAALAARDARRGGGRPDYGG